ncbi:cytoskeleton-associated protein 2-like [Acipenser oxyrinchus oxyrinchus]|uniref:Cytoskeleton-associated protein 2-like n=1 Tax=Acipenser oxyrinchus oxyrinchus TaxID=40147 RepID=A0AAD8CM37_ACIOX|nr:cytoskeleton-associated protein 2-like [Acipenser oxyrinchus oxyrinchus]
MEGDVIAPVLSRTELRQQKLMEYLAAKGKLKPPNPKPYLRENQILQKPPPAGLKPAPVSSCTGLAGGKPASRQKENLSRQPPKPGGAETKIPPKTGARGAPLPTSRPGLKTSLLRAPIRQNGASETTSKPAPQRPASSKLGCPLNQAPQPSRAPPRPAGNPLKTKGQASKPQPAKETHRPAFPSAVQGLLGHVGLKPEIGLGEEAGGERGTPTRTGDPPTAAEGGGAGDKRTRVGSSSNSKSTPNAPSSATLKPGGISKAIGTGDKASAAPRPSHGAPGGRSGAGKPLLQGDATGRTGKAAGTRVQPRGSQGTAVCRGGPSSSSQGKPQLPGRGKGVPGGAARPVKEGGAPAARQESLSAAQEERMRKLEQWRQAKGKSYKRPPKPAPQPKRGDPAGRRSFWAAIEEEDDINSLVTSVGAMLTDCLRLVQEGCPAEEVSAVLARVPLAERFSRFWLCRVRLMEREGDYDVLPLFEQAVRVLVEPIDELQSAVFEILRKKEAPKPTVHFDPVLKEPAPGSGDEGSEGEPGGGPARPVTPRVVSARLRTDKEGSSVVKYRITATPGVEARRPDPHLLLDGQELRFFTPVRRSLRIERNSRHYPPALRDHDPCVTSFRELLGGEEEEEEEERGGAPATAATVYVYRENEALRGQVHVEYIQEEEEGGSLTASPETSLPPRAEAAPSTPAAGGP